MANLKETLKKLLFEAAPVDQPAKPIESTLEDGTKISYTMLEVGEVVNAIADDGTLTPLADGDYVIDGNNVTIAKGIISVVSPVEDTPAETPQQMAATETAPAETPDTSVDLNACWKVTLSDGTFLYKNGDSVYDESGNPYPDGTVQAATTTYSYTDTLTIKNGVCVEADTATTTTISVAASEYVNEFNKFKDEITLKLSEMSKQISESGIKQAPDNTPVEVKPKATTNTGKLLERL